jgi:hypothetical protein
MGELVVALVVVQYDEDHNSNIHHIHNMDQTQSNILVRTLSRTTKISIVFSYFTSYEICDVEQHDAPEVYDVHPCNIHHAYDMTVVECN